jgi:glycosyltransferase involved in cell wall biosynthesis
VAFKNAAANVHFTDFLPNDSYYALLDSAQSVICLTTRNHTMQRGACEALWKGKPIIISDWPLLREYFSNGTIYVDNSASGIAQGVALMKENYWHYQKGIRELQVSRRREWREKLTALEKLIRH